MITLEYRRSVLKDIRRLDQSIKYELLQEIEKVRKQPDSGKPLKGDMKGYYSYSFSFTGVSYRIVYSYDIEKSLIIIEMIGSRENIYEVFKRRL
jgi:mRNA-degrading endonuclease RelE of RelBE toxin-antitoxin system